MTASDTRAHKRAWTIDRIAYGILGALALAQLARIEKVVDVTTSLSAWAHVVGEHLHLPFR